MDRLQHLAPRMIPGQITKNQGKLTESETSGILGSVSMFWHWRRQLIEASTVHNLQHVQSNLSFKFQIHLDTEISCPVELTEQWCATSPMWAV